MAELDIHLVGLSTTSLVTNIPPNQSSCVEHIESKPLPLHPPPSTLVITSSRFLVRHAVDYPMPRIVH